MNSWSKKNPLVLPPKFDQLPEPKSTESLNNEEDSFNLENVLKGNSTKKNYSSKKEITKSTLEKSILEQIQNN